MTKLFFFCTGIVFAQSPMVYPLSDALLDPYTQKQLAPMQNDLSKKIDQIETNAHIPIITFFDLENKHAFCILPVYPEDILITAKALAQPFSGYILVNLVSREKIDLPVDVYKLIDVLVSDLISGKEKLLPHLEPKDQCDVIVGSQSNLLPVRQSVRLTFFPQRKNLWLIVTQKLAKKEKFMEDDWKEIKKAFQNP